MGLPEMLSVTMICRIALEFYVDFSYYYAIIYRDVGRNKIGDDVYAFD